MRDGWLLVVMTREERSKRRAEKRARREKERGYEPPIIQLPELSDPLRTYTSGKVQMTDHPLRGLWKTAPAGFLVCGGPSLNELDLQRLKDRGVVSLGVNNVAGHAPVRAMTFSDPPEKFHQGIHLDASILKFVPSGKLGKRIRAKKPDGTFAFTAMRVMDCPSVFGYARNSDWDAKTFLTCDSASWGCNESCMKSTGQPKVLFTFLLGLRLLHYLGLRRVYLLGVDFTMLSGSGYAFNQQRTKEAATGNNNSYHVAAGMCQQLRPVFDAADFQVLNVNPKSRLTAFDAVHEDMQTGYEMALNYCKSLLPPEPFDLSFWYEKPGDKEDDRGTD